MSRTPRTWRCSAASTLAKYESAHTIRSPFPVPRSHKSVQNDGARLSNCLGFGCTRLLVLGRRYHLKLHRYSASSAGRILHLATVLGLAINGDVLPQSKFNPMAALTEPARHALIDIDELRWRKVRSSMRVYSFDKVAHESPYCRIVSETSQSSCQMLAPEEYSSQLRSATGPPCDQTCTGFPGLGYRGTSKARQ
jgi:hypothetical protein